MLGTVSEGADVGPVCPADVDTVGTVVTSVVTATASMLDVGPVEAKDEGGMVVKGGGGMTMVDELDKLFSVVGSA